MFLCRSRIDKAHDATRATIGSVNHEKISGSRFALLVRNALYCNRLLPIY